MNMVFGGLTPKNLCLDLLFWVVSDNETTWKYQRAVKNTRKSVKMQRLWISLVPKNYGFIGFLEEKTPNYNLSRFFCIF